MSKLRITVGIPGSGKTRVAELMQQDNPDDVILMCRDDFRHLFFREEGILTHPKEFYITQVMEREAKNQLRLGKEVIIHDTNLREKYRKRWATIAAEMGAEFDIIDLTSIELAVCLQRAQRRRLDGGRDVPQDVIRELHRKFIKPLQGRPVEAPQINAEAVLDLTPYEPPKGKPKAVIVDIDGTVADCWGIRSPYDYTKVALDKPKMNIIKVVQDLHYVQGYKILFVSGRLGPEGSQCEKDTEEWLYHYVKVPIEMLKMRQLDGVDDTVVKSVIFNKYIRDNYDVQFVLDDRDRVVKMWRSMGLTCLQVAEGDF